MFHSHDIFNALINAGANVNEKANVSPNYRNNYHEMIIALIKAGATVNNEGVKSMLIDNNDKINIQLSSILFLPLSFVVLQVVTKN
jgi:hypothetical protein